MTRAVMCLPFTAKAGARS